MGTEGEKADAGAGEAKGPRLTGPGIIVLIFFAAALAFLGWRAWESFRRHRIHGDPPPNHLLGEALKGKINDGARVFIFRQPLGPQEMMGGMMPPPGAGEPPGMENMPSPELMIRDMHRAWKVSLEKGAGVSLNLVGSAMPKNENAMMPMMGPDMAGPAQGFNVVLEKYEDQLDVVVSLVGVPRTLEGQWDLENLVCYKWKKKPLIVADLSVAYDPAAVRMWLQEDLLAGVVLIPAADKPEVKLITKDNLGDLPAQSPMQMMMPGSEPSPNAWPVPPVPPPAPPDEASDEEPPAAPEAPRQDDQPPPPADAEEE